MKDRYSKISLISKILFISASVLFLNCAEVLMVAATIEENRIKSNFKKLQRDVYLQKTNAPKEKENIQKFKIKSIAEITGMYKKGVLKGNEIQAFYEFFDHSGNRLECKAFEIFMNDKMYFNYKMSYDEQGKLSLMYYSNDKDGIPEFVTTIQYDENGKVLQEKTCYLKDAYVKEKLESITSYTYDSQGNKLTILKTDQQNKQLGIEKYSYDEKQRLIGISKENKSDFVHQISCTYGPDGNLTEQIISDMKNEIKEKLIFFANGKMQSKIKYKSQVLLEQTDNDYNTNGVLLKSVIIEFNNMTIEKHINYHYNDKEFLTSIDMLMTEKPSANANWIPKPKVSNYKTEYHYYGNDLLKEIVFFKNNVITQKIRYVIEYYN